MKLKSIIPKSFVDKCLMAIYLTAAIFFAFERKFLLAGIYLLVPIGISTITFLYRKRPTRIQQLEGILPGRTFIIKPEKDVDNEE